MRAPRIEPSSLELAAAHSISIHEHCEKPENAINRKQHSAPALRSSATSRGQTRANPVGLDPVQD